MHAFATIIAASGLIASVSGTPLFARETCGSAPSGSGSQTPLSQPSGIQTAQACEAQCEANTSCESFVFGMVNNAIECMLFAVPAASVPSQGSSSLVVYDKACSSIPAVVPTSSNPTGAATSNTDTNGNHKRSTCGTAPSGSGSQTPLSQPSGITTASACEAQCESNTSCQSFVFGMVNSAIECMLFAVPAASVPSQGSSNLVVYGKACPSIPAVVPTSSNPAGANTGSSSTAGNAGANNGANNGATRAGN